MKSVLNIKFTPVGIVLIFRKGREIYAEEVKEAEDALERLDKILKRSKIRITDIKNIRIKNSNLVKDRYTSYRIIKSIEKALRFSIKFK